MVTFDVFVSTSKALGLIGLSGVFLAVLFSVSAFSQDVPRIEYVDECFVEVSGGVEAECGNLIVWENRKTKKRTIKTPFIRLKTQNPKPKGDPVVYTAGGPGVSSLGRARGAQYLRRYMEERDFLIFEQRGTTFASPSLDCPEVEEYFKNSKNSSGLRNSLNKCRKRLTNSGVDLNSYNSLEIARDLEDLRTQLGIEKWNLFGMSYSTKIMLTYVREFRKHVRSVVLDSPLPLSVNYDETSTDTVFRALEKVFSRCEAEMECSKKYPDLRDSFYLTVRRLNEKPIRIDISETNKREFRGSDFVSLISSGLNYPDAISLIPSKIVSAKNVDSEFLDDAKEYFSSGSSFVLGMRYSVWCSEEMPFQYRERIGANFSRFEKLGGLTIQKDIAEICDVWKVKPAEVIESKPVVSDVPALILSGTFDPATPPEWGLLVYGNLESSYFFEFPEMGHLINFNSSCGIGMIAEFIKRPESKPDSGCLKTEKRINFR